MINEPWLPEYIGKRHREENMKQSGLEQQRSNQFRLEDEKMVEAQTSEERYRILIQSIQEKKVKGRLKN